MAQNSFSILNLSNDPIKAASSSIWTVASACEHESASNNIEMLVPSPSNPTELPPNYYDISNVPNKAVLNFDQVKPFTEGSKAAVERKTEGVISRDSLLDKNPDQLWLYFMTYLREKPTLLARIHGYYTEQYTTRELIRGADGKFNERVVCQTRTITEFCYAVDLTGYIASRWWRVAVTPSNQARKAGEFVSLRNAIEQYTRSDRSIKNIVCEKQLCGWEFGDLSCKIKSIVRATGYRNEVSVTFSVGNSRIEAQSSSCLNRFSKSKLVRVLCVLSCMCLIFGPIYCCIRAVGSTRNRIVADYHMLTTVDQFLQFNAGTIATAATCRSRDTFVAYLA